MFATPIESQRHYGKQLASDALVIDDGFQNMRILRDVNIVRLTRQSVGNKMVLPAGILRANQRTRRATA